MTEISGLRCPYCNNEVATKNEVPDNGTPHPGVCSCCGNMVLFDKGTLRKPTVEEREEIKHPLLINPEYVIRLGIKSREEVELLEEGLRTYFTVSDAVPKGTKIASVLFAIAGMLYDALAIVPVADRDAVERSAMAVIADGVEKWKVLNDLENTLAEQKEKEKGPSIKPTPTSFL